MIAPDRIEAMRKATPSARVAFARQTVAILDEIEDWLIDLLEWRCQVIDDIWNDIFPDDPPLVRQDDPKAVDALADKLLTLGCVVNEGWFNKFPRVKDGPCVRLFEMTEAEWTEIERRLLSRVQPAAVQP